jgi:hypothetical protein
MNACIEDDDEVLSGGILGSLESPELPLKKRTKRVQVVSLDTSVSVTTAQKVRQMPQFSVGIKSKSDLDNAPTNKALARPVL